MSGNKENNDAANGNEPKTEQSPPVSPTDWRVITLGIYLILTLLLGVYLLGVMVMAEDASKVVGDLAKSCCGEDGKNCPPPTSTPAKTADEPKPDANVSNANNASQTAVNSVNANAANSVNANQTATANTTANKPANTAANSANVKTEVKTTPTPSSTPNTIPEISIPPYLCVRNFNPISPNSPISADGFCFCWFFLREWSARRCVEFSRLSAISEQRIFRSAGRGFIFCCLSAVRRSVCFFTLSFAAVFTVRPSVKVLF